MLTEKELEIMRKNGQVHKKVFEAVKEILVPGVCAKQLDDLALKICNQAGVLSAFTGVYGYKYSLQTSVNNVVVHGRPLQSIIFED
jgi:methionyl aminopeptidase